MQASQKRLVCAVIVCVAGMFIVPFLFVAGISNGFVV